MYRVFAPSFPSRCARFQLPSASEIIKKVIFAISFFADANDFRFHPAGLANSLFFVAVKQSQTHDTTANLSFTEDVRISSPC